MWVFVRCVLLLHGSWLHRWNIAIISISICSVYAVAPVRMPGSNRVVNGFSITRKREMRFAERTIMVRSFADGAFEAVFVGKTANYILG